MAPAEVSRPARASRTPLPEAALSEELCHPRGHLKSCLLVLLDECSSHGYELYQRVKPLGYDHDDPARVYRALHWLEGKGLIKHRWDVSGTGPARRVFDLTPAGRDMVSGCASALDKQLRALKAHLVPDQAGQTDGQTDGQDPPATQGGRSFEVVVEAKLSVQAPDQESAGRAAQRALGTGRLIAPNVRSGGEVCVYEAIEADNVQDERRVRITP